MKQVRDVFRVLSRRSKYPTTETLPIGAYLESFIFARIDEEGRLRIERTQLLRAIEGVEIGRIRICDICRKFFWAGRIDQSCCSHKCTGVKRTRNWRANYFLKYKQQRVSRLDESNTSNKQHAAAQTEQERHQLESNHAPTFAKRPARLPKR
jgi:hypothetical protein